MRGSEKNAKNLHFWSFLAKKGHFGQFLAKMAKTVKIFKKALGTFFLHLQAVTNCKVSEQVMNGFREKAPCTYVRTDKRTDATPKVSTTSWSRDQKWSKYRFKQPKFIVLGTPKNPEKGQE